jgi:carbon starvation protein CstA
VASLLVYCAFLAALFLPGWIEGITDPKADFDRTVGELFVLRIQVIPCLVLAALALIPRLTEFATATAAFIVLCFGVLVALVELRWGIPSLVTGTLLIVALAIGRWPIVDRG